MVKIYALKDTRTLCVMYIGQTVQPLGVRLSGHVNNPIQKDDRKGVWVRELKSLNLKPIIEVIEEVAEISAYDREMFYIKYHQAVNPALLNVRVLTPKPKSKRQIKISAATAVTCRKGGLSLKGAVKLFFNSGFYKEKSKLKTSEGSVLRNNKYRNEQGRLGDVSAIAMLKRYGYTVKQGEIDVKAPPEPPRKATPKKKKK